MQARYAPSPFRHSCQGKTAEDETAAWERMALVKHGVKFLSKVNMMPRKLDMLRCYAWGSAWQSLEIWAPSSLSLPTDPMMQHCFFIWLYSRPYLWGFVQGIQLASALWWWSRQPALQNFALAWDNEMSRSMHSVASQWRKKDMFNESAKGYTTVVLLV